MRTRVYPKPKLASRDVLHRGAMIYHGGRWRIIVQHDARGVHTRLVPPNKLERLPPAPETVEGDDDD